MRSKNQFRASPAPHAVARRTGRSRHGTLPRLSATALAVALLLSSAAVPAQTATLAPTLTPAQARTGFLAALRARLGQKEDDNKTAKVRKNTKTGSQTVRAALVVQPANVTQGAWSAEFSWPIIAIHVSMLPDGRVLSYGTDQAGNQGGQFVYDVWDPITGIHSTLPNTTGTDLFCSAQIVLPGTRTVLITGGDTRGLNNGTFNFGVRDVNLFDATANTLTPAGLPMTYARWYPTLTTLPDGRIFNAGGIDENGVAVSKPEMFTPGQGWTVMSTINLPGWFYPRNFVSPRGDIYGYVDGSEIYRLDPSGTGTYTGVGNFAAPPDWQTPSVMYDRGKILALLFGGRVGLLDINGATPVISETAPTAANRYWASTVVLPDGKVVLTGGGSIAPADPVTGAPGVANSGYQVALDAQIWDPATGLWTQGASEVAAREYHSTALLLQDGSVLVSGGGAPGPVKQLNAEVYYPPYLFNASGGQATRPVISSAPTTLTLATPYDFTVASGASVAKVALVKTGAVTHSFDMEQRYLPVPFTVTGNTVHLNVAESSNTLPPGYYHLFVLNAAGTPSISKIVSIPSTFVAPSVTLADSITTFAGNTRIGMNGNASIVGAALRLTPATPDQAGSAVYRAPLALDGQSSFSTRVQFRIGGGNGADGMTFMLTGNPMALGAAGGGLGYTGIAGSLAVKLDTYFNTGVDPYPNFLGVLTNGDPTPLATFQVPFTLRDNNLHSMWVEYQGQGNTLRIYLNADPNGTRPIAPALTLPNVDLPAVVTGGRAYFGFSAATGGLSDVHAVEGWNFAAGRSAVEASGTVNAGEQLFPWEGVWSQNGQYFLNMQTDGNLVIYNVVAGNWTPLWASNTAGAGSAHLMLKTDGNLVLAGLDGATLWQSNTAGRNAVKAVLDNSGNLSLVTPGNVVVWDRVGGLH